MGASADVFSHQIVAVFTDNRDIINFSQMYFYVVGFSLPAFGFVTDYDVVLQWCASESLVIEIDAGEIVASGRKLYV